MATDQEIAKMPLQEVVQLPGGNGLASPPFQIPLNILGIFGWHNIESGVEACVCDGALIPSTKAKTEFIRLIGRRSFVRRVLLRPGPIEVVSTALTKDELKLTLALSVKYEVDDPVYVSSLSDPLTELRNFFEGITAEYIRSKSFDEFISDSGEVRKVLKSKFQNAETIKNKYIIHEVLKAIPSGDESLVEIKRKIRAASQERELIDVEGVNREVEALHNLAIERERTTLDEEIAQRKHEREKEIRELEAKSDILKTAISTLGQVASSGVDPRGLTSEVMDTIVGRVQQARLSTASNPSLPESQPVSQPNVESQIEKEKRALASIKGHLGIITYEVLESQAKVVGAIIQMASFEIIFKCGENYPDQEPETTVRFTDGGTQTIKGYWIPGISTTLAQALMVVIPQINPNKE